MFRELIRKNNQLSMEECIQILTQETRGVLSVHGEHGYPYGTPMNHFYNAEDGAIYFHCGKIGHRLDALKENNKVSFCTYNSGVRPEGDWAFLVKSVIVFGTIEIIDDMNSIIEITTKLSYKFIQDEDHIRDEIERAGHKTLLLKLTPEHICGKLVKES